MKKSIIITMSIASLLMFACSNNKAKNTNESVAPSVATEVSEESKETVAVANPYVTVDSLEEASKIAGFSLKVPDSIDGYKQVLVEAMQNSIIQLVYQGEEQEISIRKALGTDDSLIGDYTQYPTNSEVTLSNNSVLTIKGEDEYINLAYWQKDGYTYAIYSSGLGLEEVTKLAESIE